MFWELFQHRGNIVPHVNGDLTFNTVVKFHPQVLVNLSTSYLDISNRSVCLPNPFNEVSYHIWVNMTHFQIIHMPAYGELISFYHLVCHAWVVWIYLEPILDQIRCQLLVE